jgi:hypothetical protein
MAMKTATKRTKRFVLAGLAGLLLGLVTTAGPALAQRPDFCYKVIYVDGARYYESIAC